MTDTSQRTGQKLSACLVAPDRLANLGLTLDAWCWQTGAGSLHGVRGACQRPACCLDEKRAFTHRRMAGLEVFPVCALQEQMARHSIGPILIALTGSSPLRMRALTRKLVQSGVWGRRFRNPLDMHEQREVRATLSALRLFGLCVQGKNRLVTSAGDSIAAERCRAWHPPNASPSQYLQLSSMMSRTLSRQGALSSFNPVS